MPTNGCMPVSPGGEGPGVDAGAGAGPAHEFIALWRSGACDDAAQRRLADILRRCPLSGRVTHGHSSDPGFGERLSEGWKRLSWVFGPAALPSLLGKSAREICVGLGLSEVRECVLGTARD